MLAGSRLLGGLGASLGVSRLLFLPQRFAKLPLSAKGKSWQQRRQDRIRKHLTHCKQIFGAALKRWYGQQKEIQDVFVRYRLFVSKSNALLRSRRGASPTLFINPTELERLLYYRPSQFNPREAVLQYLSIKEYEELIETLLLLMSVGDAFVKKAELVLEVLGESFLETLGRTTAGFDQYLDEIFYAIRRLIIILRDIANVTIVKKGNKLFVRNDASVFKPIFSINSRQDLLHLRKLYG